MNRDPAINEMMAQLRELSESFHINPCPDFPSYMERVGQCNGLKKAIEITLSIYNQDED
jgi:hypothetical protein